MSFFRNLFVFLPMLIHVLFTPNPSLTMEIKLTIGREESKHRLLFRVADENVVISTAVPNSVSRRHCQLTVLDNGKMILQNLSPNNVTWVNDMAIESCAITANDQIHLGYDKFLLDWEWINTVVRRARSKTPQEISIKHLERVYENYKNELDAIQKSQSRLNTIRGITPIITLGAVATSMVMGKEWATKYGQGFMMTAYGLAILITVLVFLKSWFDLSKIPQKKEELNQRFLAKFRCPNCGYFFGYQSFAVINANLDGCPKCGAVFKK